MSRLAVVVTVLIVAPPLPESVLPGGTPSLSRLLEGVGAELLAQGRDFEELVTLLPSAPGPDDAFGSAVALSDDTAIVGAPDWDVGPGDTNEGAAYIFARPPDGTNAWAEVVRLTASDAQVGDTFGSSVVIDGDTAIVGAPGEDGGPGDPLLDAGAAYIFERHQGGPNNWGEVAKLTASTAGVGDAFGTSVAIDRDRVVVGAPFGAPFNGGGAAYVFERNRGGPSNWGEAARPGDDHSAIDDRVGQSVAVSGDTIFLGAPGADGGPGDPVPDAGSVYIFQLQMPGGNNWLLWKELAASDAQTSDTFGSSVAIDGDTAVIGAGTEDGGPGDPLTDAGAAYVFERDATTGQWGEIVKLTASDAQIDDAFGASVAILGDTVAVGATGENGGPGDPVPDAGAVYLMFHRTETGLDTWEEVARLTASTAAMFDHLGQSVALSYDTVIAGAPQFPDLLNDGSGFASVFGPGSAVNGVPVYGFPQRLLELPMMGAGIAALAAADFNGDGLVDVVFTRGDFPQTNAFPLTILLNDGAGSFVDGTATLFGGAPPSIKAGGPTIGDFNGDGRPDFFLADFGIDAPPFSGAQNRLVLSTLGGLVDATANLPQQVDVTGNVATADIDGDGDVDLYVGNLCGGACISPQIWLNDGAGRFTVAAGRLPASVEDLSQRAYTDNEFADVNGDGVPDLILSGIHPNNPSEVLLNNGAGHFSILPNALPPRPFASNAIGQDIETADLNQDGDQDLLMAYTKDNPFHQGRWIQVLINNGDGTFRDETATRLPQSDNFDNWITKLELVDIDGDGNLDLTARLTSGISGIEESPLFYLNDGTGMFTPLPAGFGNTFENLFVMLDVDGDGGHDFFTLQQGHSSRPEKFYIVRDAGPAIVPGIPAAVRANSSLFADLVRLAWPYVWGATSYEVWRSTSPNAPGTLIGTTTRTTFDDTTVSGGAIFYYTVRAVNAAGQSLPSLPAPGQSGFSDVTIDGHPSGDSFAHTSPFLDLSGTAGTLARLADAPAATVTGVTWENDRGGNGPTEGTTTWRAPVIPLQPGANTITIRATDDTGNMATASITVTVSQLLYYLAEGATGPFFDLDLLLGNPNAVDTPVSITYLKEDGSTILQNETLTATSQRSISVNSIPGLEMAAVSMVVSSDNGLPLAVERSMLWDASVPAPRAHGVPAIAPGATHYGGHTAKAVDSPQTRWLFAEGSQGFFDTYLLLANANPTPADVTVTYLVEGGAPVVQNVVVGGTSRLTLFAGSLAPLVGTSFGISVTSSVPIIAERAMYFSAGRFWEGGHESAGVPEAATSWFLAEGATGDFFDTFVLVSNPNGGDATLTVTYLLDSGVTIVKPHTVPGNGRITINVESQDAQLASAAVSTTVTSDVPVVVERAMYWVGGFTTWYEAHNAFGVTATSTKWGLAEGRVGTSTGYQTFILLANPAATAAQVRITYLRTNGTTVVKTYTVPPTSRFNVWVNAEVPGLVDERFGALIEVTNDVAIAVERALYWDDGGQTWGGGTNATAVRLP